MERRAFLTGACLAGVAGLNSALAGAQADSGNQRDYYELRQYRIKTEDQKQAFDTFMRDAGVAAYNRIGINPVGVFYHTDELSPIWVLLRHTSLQSFAAAAGRLLEDKELLGKGAAFLDSPAKSPAYERIEVSLMAAFDGMARLETPIKEPGRIFQLRMYESASEKAGQKKIEMFNNAEISIFRKTGLNPVFFGQNLSGSKMPNLTYMLVFRSMEENKENWKRFINNPEWKQLRSIPEYADEKIVSNITNMLLKPAEYSQI